MSNVNADPRAARKEAQNDLTTEPLPSVAGGVSWMLGLVSIPLIFVPPAAVLTAFLAIVFGHISKYKIKRRPELGGESSATNGLLMGYLCFFAALALLPSIRMQSSISQGFWDSIRGIQEAKSGSLFDAAERSFLDNGSPSTGNNKDAREIAASLALSLNEQRNEVFNGPVALEIRTLCQRNQNGACVVAIVPDLAEFEDDARRAMLNLIWKQSQKEAFGRLTPGEDFVVAVRDRIRYHSMEFGRATKSRERIAQPDSSFLDVTMLDSFFEPEENEALETTTDQKGDENERE